MPRHPDLHRHGGLPRSTLQLWLQRQHYAQGTLWKILYTSFTRNNHVFVACRSDTKFHKGNIEEPLHPSWYLVRPSKHLGNRDWFWWEGTRHLREVIPEHLRSCHLCSYCQDQFLYQGKEGDVFLQEQDYINPKGNPDMNQGRGPIGGTGTSKCGPSN